MNDGPKSYSKPNQKLGADFHFSAIGFVKTPFHDRFGIPRQPGLVASAKGTIKFLNEPDLRTALRELDQFSHLWIVFVFHEHGGKDWKPSIRPPRLGGAQKVGVLASRSPHRPNPIGMSAVKFDGMNLDAKGGPEVYVSGVDLLDGTPVLDIKPYIPYADSIAYADAGWASDAIKEYEVRFSETALASIALLANDIADHSASEFQHLIADVLKIDPRPASQKTKVPVEKPENRGLQFGIDLLNGDVRYEIVEGGFLVVDVVKRSL